MMLEQSVQHTVDPEEPGLQVGGSGTQAFLPTPTSSTYPEIENVYNVFNREFFGGMLPPALITLRAKEKRVMGYFSSRKFISPTGEITDELALNPTYLRKRGTYEGLQTIVHEMVHMWQFHANKVSRRTYHDAVFADKMEEIGLVASDTGLPGGKRTGQKMGDYPIADGPFDLLARKLIAAGFVFPWAERHPDDQAEDEGPAELAEQQSQAVADVLGETVFHALDEVDDNIGPLSLDDVPGDSPKVQPSDSGLTQFGVPDFDASGTPVYPDYEPRDDAPKAVTNNVAAKSPGRISFICSCKQRIWGKPSILAICGLCKQSFVAVNDGA